jgi:hypothetical protein
VCRGKARGGARLQECTVTSCVELATARIRSNISGTRRRPLREAVATGLLAYPLFERDALLDKIRKAPEFVQFMAELKGTVDGHRRELEGLST